MRIAYYLTALLFILSACDSSGEAVQPDGGSGTSITHSADQRPFQITSLGKFDEPWAMTFLPNGLLLVTEKAGRILFLDPGRPTPFQPGFISGVPQVAYGGQGGLGDIVPHPDFLRNNIVYISYVEAGPDGTRGAAVARARLVLDNMETGRLEGLQTIWRQEPKVKGQGHFSHRLAFSPDGYLFITSGERQKLAPAQDMDQNLGKIIRLTDTGGIVGDNPFYDKGRIALQIWSLGHRNILGLAFDKEGRLWADEMGPMGGDEVNLIEKGKNYGWPIVSNGDDYDGSPIPDHPTRPEFAAPKIWWNPSISPSSLMIYSGALFPQWRGSAFIGALSGRALIRVELEGDRAHKADQWDMGKRIREVEQGPDGAIYLLEDGPGGRLLKLTPAS